MIPPRSFVSSVYCAWPARSGRGRSTARLQELPRASGPRPRARPCARRRRRRVGAHRAVLGDHALVLDGHLPAGERHHPRAERDVPVVERRAPERLLHPRRMLTTGRLRPAGERRAVEEPKHSSIAGRRGAQRDRPQPDGATEQPRRCRAPRASRRARTSSRRVRSRPADEHERVARPGANEAPMIESAAHRRSSPMPARAARSGEPSTASRRAGRSASSRQQCLDHEPDRRSRSHRPEPYLARLAKQPVRALPVLPPCSPPE